MNLTIITFRPVCRVTFENPQFDHSGHYNESGDTSHRPLFTQKRHVPQVTVFVSEMMVITTTMLIVIIIIIIIIIITTDRTQLQDARGNYFPFC